MPADPITLDPDYSLKPLLAALITDAVHCASEQSRSVRRKQGSAMSDRAWLLSDECQDYCEMIGVDWNIIRAWVMGGCRHHPRRAARKTV